MHRSCSVLASRFYSLLLLLPTPWGPQEEGSHICLSLREQGKSRRDAVRTGGHSVPLHATTFDVVARKLAKTRAARKCFTLDKPCSFVNEMTESFACDICHVLCPLTRLVLLCLSLHDGYGQSSVNTQGHYGQRRDVCALWQAFGGSWRMHHLLDGPCCLPSNTST